MTTRTGRWRPLAALWRERTRALGTLLALLAVATVAVWATRDRQPVGIVEMGFSPTPAVGGDQERADGVSWGAILENTSDRAAYGVVLRTTYHDADGNTAIGYHTVDVLLPRARLGVGHHRFRAGMPDLDGPLVDVEITVDHITSWRAPEEHVAITAEDVWAGHSPDGELAWAFVARSRADEPVESIDARAVFRDADGRIVGGSESSRGPLRPDRPTDAWVLTQMEIPDASTVEVYLLPEA